jgi:FkbM family methyltransferase
MYNEIFRDACYLHNDFFKMDEITEVIFDCGANIGLFTLWAALRCPNATIYAFEPIPQIFYTMTRNIARYNFSNRVQAYNIGLGELPANGGAHDQEVDFRFYPELSSMSTCLWQEHELVRKFGTEGALDRFEVLKCKVRCLGDIIEETGVKKIDYLKIDVEGKELDVINGLYEDDWKGIQQVCAEVQPSNDKKERNSKPFLHTKALRWKNPKHVLSILIIQTCWCMGEDLAYDK